MSTTINVERHKIYQRRDGELVNMAFEWEAVPGNPDTRYFAEAGLSRDRFSWRPDGTYMLKNPAFDLVRELDDKTAEEILKGRSMGGHIAPPGSQLFKMIQTGENHGTWELLPKTGA